LVSHDLDLIGADALRERTADHDSAIRCAVATLMPAVVKVYSRNQAIEVRKRLHRNIRELSLKILKEASVFGLVTTTRFRLARH
jgi:hypothetical protein